MKQPIKWLLACCACVSHIPSVSACFAKLSQPNPIASQYPNSATGTINGTVSIIPIPYAQARSIVPSQYPILTKQYEKLMPGLNGMYPAMLQIELDHDVQSAGNRIPDFQRAAFYYPFVDRLNDGYTAMAYSTYILLSNNTLAIAGTQVYGYTVDVSSFVPTCEAYIASGSDGGITQKGKSLTTSAAVTVNFSPSDYYNPWSLTAYKNLTNQPTFSNAPGICDNYIRLYNTTVTEGKYTPQSIKGTVQVVAPLFPQTKTFTNIYGLKMDNAFIENNYVTCQSLEGATATGPGD